MATTSSGASGIYLSRTTSFDAALDWTWAKWIYFPANQGGSVWVKGDIAESDPYVAVFDNNVGTGANGTWLETWDGSTDQQTTHVSFTRNHWYYIAVTYTASTHALVFYQGDQTTNVSAIGGGLTANISTFVFVSDAEQVLGDTGAFGIEGVASEYDRVWSSVLTPTQLNAEKASLDAVITAALEADCRIAAAGNVTDASGNGNDWTTHGALTYTAGPLPPVNLTPTLATAITTLPYSLASLDVQDAPTGTAETAPSCSAIRGNEVWFTYTTSTTDVVLSITSNAVLDTGNYDPKTSLWTGTPGALVQYTVGTGGGLNHFCNSLGGFYMNVPVAPSTLYYIRVDYNSTTQPLDDTLTLSLDTAPHNVASPDSIMIPDDEVGYPAIILSGTANQTILSGVRFPAGEFAGVLADGTSCVVDDVTTRVAIYDAQLQLVTTVDYTPSVVFSIASNYLDTFYVAVRDGSNTTVVHTLDATGAAGSTTWTLGDTSHRLSGMAPNRTGTILYYIAATTSSIVYAYDLTNSVALADLHAGFGGENGYGNGCGFVSPTGTIWFGFSTGGATSGVNGTLREFDSAGTVLQTWTVVDATYVELNKFALASDQASVFVWTFNAGRTLARFQRLNLSDQSVVSTATFRVTGTSGDPSPVQWNISNSCPLMVIWAALTPVTTSTDPIRRLRRFEIADDRHLTQFLRRIEFYCQPGTGLVTGQGSDPTLMFRLSKDGGITWSTEQTMSIGAMGDYTKRAYLIGLGSGRHLVGEISCSDPTTFALVDCLADLDGGTS